jgi:S-adenosylmethionine uptake transporter
MLSMLFYSALVTTLLGFLPAFYFWQNPTLPDLILLFCLGAGSNLILFCLLKGFALVAVSAVAPYRYLEVVFSTIFGYIIFIETPGFYTYIGALIIIPTTLMIAKRQMQD